MLPAICRTVKLGLLNELKRQRLIWKSSPNNSYSVPRWGCREQDMSQPAINSKKLNTINTPIHKNEKRFTKVHMSGTGNCKRCLRRGGTRTGYHGLSRGAPGRHRGSRRSETRRGQESRGALGGGQRSGVWPWSRAHSKARLQPNPPSEGSGVLSRLRAPRSSKAWGQNLGAPSRLAFVDFIGTARVAFETL